MRKWFESPEHQSSCGVLLFTLLHSLADTLCVCMCVCCSQCCSLAMFSRLIRSNKPISISNLSPSLSFLSSLLFSFLLSASPSLYPSLT